MVTIILLLIMQYSFIAVAGYLNSIMDLIAQFDCLKQFGYLWSKAAMEAPKNGWWEKHFPKDYWHTAKRYMIGCFGFAIAFSFVGGVLASIRIHDYYVLSLFAICEIVVSWIVFSVSFEYFYSNGRRKYC